MPHALEPTLDELKQLFQALINRPKLRRGPTWTDDWPGCDKDTWQPDCCSVYVLWREEFDLEQGKRPVYIGEGITGPRVWKSFQLRKEWNFAQILYHEKIASNADDRDASRDRLNWRKLLERFAIVVLQPESNVG